MMNSNLNLSALPECKFAYQMVNSALLIPCAEYQRVLHVEKVAHIAENFSEYVANEPKVSFRDGRFYIFDGQNTVEARRTCNGGMELPICCNCERTTYHVKQIGQAAFIHAKTEY